MNQFEERSMSIFDRGLGRALIWPGMKLMRALAFPAKMVVMGCVLLLPLTWLTAQSLHHSQKELHITQVRAQAGPIIRQALEVATQTQKHRGLSFLALHGDATVAVALGATRDKLAASLATMQSGLQQYPGPSLAAWAPIKLALEDLSKGAGPGDPDKNFALHSAQVAAIRHFMLGLAEGDGQSVDPNARTFLLATLVKDPLLEWTDSLGQLRGRASALARRGEVTAAEREALASQRHLLLHSIATVERLSQALQRAGEPPMGELEEAIRDSQAYARRVAEVVEQAQAGADSRALFDAGTSAIGRAVTVGLTATKRLEDQLLDRTAALKRDLLLSWVAGLGTVIGVAYLTLVFFRTSFGAVRVLQGAVTQLAAGDFATRIRLRGTDELSVVGQSIDTMTGRISEMVADIRSNSSMVAQAGLNLADDTRAMSERTDAQASSLKETNARMGMLSQAVSQSAQGAEAASDRAMQVRQMAEEGGSAIQSAVISMQAIQTSSMRVQEIVGVIESISFQTNILALNAAVEAARAGEQGRGFAVVASEVRSLAQRSADSAREIKSLISASAESVQVGVSQIGAASATFAKIVQGIREVAEGVLTVKEGAAEQSAGLEQIAQVMSSIDEITQRNSQMVVDAFHNSSQLSDRAKRLSEAVASFRLRQGSADEALALVQRGLALCKNQGGAALAQITASGKEFSDRDMYVFAFDRKGVYKAFAGNASKIGTMVRDNPGVDGDKLVRDAFERAAHGGGWVDYDFANPQTGAVDQKTSYIEPLSADLVLGCGVYKSKGAATSTAGPAPRLDQLRGEQRERLLKLTPALST
jgi:methyl-accepting chemotaxis protein